MFKPCFAPIDEKLDRATVRLEHAAPGILVATISGYGTEEVAARILQSARVVYEADGRYHAFHDWSGLTGYESGARATLTAWGRQHPHARVTILFQSRLVAMGVSVATLALPTLASFSDRAAFEAARARAIAEALARP